ncbi:MAG: hypothetical protein JOZ96_14665 [Acidobacteria bacterium]|nr:hypothetical protein [Acidobacteriota bacterium]
MRKLYLFFFVLSLFALAPAGARARQTAAAQQRLIGEVTAVDAAAHTVTVRSDAGQTVTLSTTEQTTYTRLAPGVTDLKQGEKVTFEAVRVGDRVLAPGVAAAGGTAARLIVMARPGGGGGGQNAGRRLNGRVVSVDAAKKLIVVQTRGREGQESATVDVSAARVLHYAPDSMRPADAVPASLADVHAGDNIRATGERSAGGSAFKAEEVLTGSFARFTGTVAGVDAQRNEVTVKNEASGGTVRLTLGARSTLRRMTPEVEQKLAEQRAEFQRQREQRRAERQQQGGQQGQGQGQAQGQGEGGRGRRGDGQGRGGFGGPGGGGGGNFQQMFEGLPTVTLADLKKGDMVMVTVTPSADASSGTVVSLITGTPEVLRSMQQFGGGRGGDGPRGMSPGLPGDVIGNGQGPTREPPR